MAAEDDEEKLVRTVALHNAKSILQARQQAEEALRKQSEWLRITLTSIGDGVISTDALGRVTFMNGVAEELTGWPQNEAIGRPLPEVFISSTNARGNRLRTPRLRAFQQGTSWGWRTIRCWSLAMARKGQSTMAPRRCETRPARCSGRCWSSGTSPSGSGRSSRGAAGRDCRSFRGRDCQQDA